MLSRFTVVLHETVGVPVGPITAGLHSGARMEQALEQLRSTPLQHPQTNIRRQIPGEGQAQVEDTIVVTRVVLGRQELLEEGLAPLGNAVHLLAPAAPGRSFAGPEGGQLPAERAGQGDRRRDGIASFDSLHRAGALQAAKRGVQRPERHATAEAEPIRQPLLQLVAVQLLLLEESEDGQLEHDPSSIHTAMYRHDISRD